MRDAFQVAGEHMLNAGGANKRRYDGKARSTQISVGDYVLVRNTEKGGTGKLRSWWENKLYIVEEMYDHVPVFVIIPVGGGKEKTVHRNMLMKAAHLPLNTFGQEEVVSEDSLPPAPRRRGLRPRSTVPRALRSSSSSESEYDTDAVHTPDAAPDRFQTPLIMFRILVQTLTMDCVALKKCMIWTRMF